MEKLHSVCCQSGYPMYRWTGLGSTAPAGDMRYKLVVQAFSIASHHSAPPALPHGQENVEARQGSLVHLAQAMPSSKSAWRVRGQSLSSPVLLMAYEGRGFTSTRQASSIHPRGGCGAHLFYSLKHWLQPLAVDFTVTVQEGEDVSSSHFSSSHPRANQPYNEERTAEEQEY